MDAQYTSLSIADVPEDEDALLHCFIVWLLMNILLTTHCILGMQINSSVEKLPPSFV